MTKKSKEKREREREREKESLLEDNIRSPDQVIQECLLENDFDKYRQLHRTHSMYPLPLYSPYQDHIPDMPEIPPPSYFSSRNYEEERSPISRPETQDQELEWIYEQMVNACIEESKNEETKEESPREPATEYKDSYRYETPSPEPQTLPPLFPISQTQFSQNVYFDPIPIETSTTQPENPALHPLNIKMKRLHSIENVKETKKIYEYILQMISPDQPTQIRPQSQQSHTSEEKEKAVALLKTIRFTPDEKQLLKEIFE